MPDFFDSTKNITPYIKSGTHIEQGRQFLNEHKIKKPQLYRMSSQPSQTHIDALEIMESHAQQKLDAEIHRIVENSDAKSPSDSRAVENSMIESICNKIKGKR